MISPIDTINAHIARSRELEKNVTEGPWFPADWHQDNGPDKTTVEAQKPDTRKVSIWPNGIVKMIVAETEEGENPLVDAAFIAASRTLLPHNVEALSVAVDVLEAVCPHCRRTATDALSKIATILSP